MCGDLPCTLNKLILACVFKFHTTHKCVHKTFRIDEMNKSFQPFDESEDSLGCASWGTGHTPLLPLDLGGLRPPDYNWSIEGWVRIHKIIKKIKFFCSFHLVFVFNVNVSGSAL